MSRSLLGGREHQITHAKVDLELNGVIHGNVQLRLLRLT